MVRALLTPTVKLRRATLLTFPMLKRFDIT